MEIEESDSETRSIDSFVNTRLKNNNFRINKICCIYDHKGVLVHYSSCITKEKIFEVAVKEIKDIDAGDLVDILDVDQEGYIHSLACNHPNVVKLFDSYFEVSPKLDYVLIVEYMPTNLQNFISLFHLNVTKRNNNKKTKREICRSVMKQLLSALNHLQSLRVIHADVKPENILVRYDEITNTIEMKLCDFGIAKMYDDQADHFSVLYDRKEESILYLTTVMYRAPELLLRDMIINEDKFVASTNFSDRIDLDLECAVEHIKSVPVTHKLDIWAAGVVFFEIMWMFYNESETKYNLYRGEKQGFTEFIIFRNIINTWRIMPSASTTVGTLYGHAQNLYPIGIPDMVPVNSQEIQHLCPLFEADLNGGQCSSAIDLFMSMQHMAQECRPSAACCLSHAFFQN